jgi:HK97 family phage prohead protease
MTSRAERLAGAPERRTLPISEFETRRDSDKLTLTGYASVFDAPYEMYGGPSKGGWTEIVDQRAFDVTLRAKPDVHLLINHEGMPLARTKSGTLKLSSDKTGLHVEADLDRRDPEVLSLEVKMQRGDMDEMSFAFRTLGQKWNDDETERRLTELSLDKGDVSVVNFGANPATKSQIRQLHAALDCLSELDPDVALVEARALAGDPVVQLMAARSMINDLLRTMQDPALRRLTIAEAERIASGV